MALSGGGQSVQGARLLVSLLRRAASKVMHHALLRASQAADRNGLKISDNCGGIRGFKRSQSPPYLTS